MNRQIFRVGVAALSIALLGAAGCKKLMNSNGMKPSSDSVNTSAKVSSYPLHGMVLGKSAQSSKIIIQQAAIRGYMPATNAIYTLKDASLFRQLQPGDHITADVLVPADYSFSHLTNIKVVAQPSHPMTTEQLPAHLLLVGENVPPTPMVNQNGKPTALTDFRGKAVLITFIDTECTDDCPVISHLFAEIDQQLAKNPKAYAASDLITISIDPAHDTPAVLHAYGLKYLNGKASGFQHWQFVHLTPANLKRIATAFGVSYEQVKGDIEHTMVISLIAPDNTLQQSWSGDDWDPKVIAQAVEDSIAKSHGTAPVTAKKTT